jgi:hypothetical protein
MDDRRFNSMSQSILLASRLLEIGMPYLASWLPEPNFRAGYNPRVDAWAEYDIVDIHTAPADRDIQATRNELNEISNNIEWWEDPEMLPNNGWWGITASCYPRATSNFSQRQIVSSEAMDNELKSAGYNRRQNTIGLASQYVDTLLNSDRTSEQHLCAAFHLAVTSVHEIGHLVYWQNLENKLGPMGFEPSVDDQPYQELGFAFTAWLFGGWNPQPIVDSRKDPKLFQRGMCWVKQLGRQTRPRWTMHYSMPFAYVQQIMTQSTWDAWIGNLGHPGAKAIITAPAPFRYGQNARTARCEKHATGEIGWSWKKPQPLNVRFVNEDDDEDFGNMPPGIPPFGFLDPDWTAGPEAEVYSGSMLETYESPPERPPPAPKVANINVIYSGIYDEVTGSVHPAANPRKHARYEGSGENAHGEPSSKRVHYADWPEGVLRSLCSKRDISNFGERSELVARLEQFDAAEADRHLGASENPPEAPEGSPAARNQLALLTFALIWSTRVIALKQLVYKDAGIPVGQQRLQFGEGGPILQESSAESPLGDWSHIDEWDNILLYRIQRAPKEDPGPQAHSGDSGNSQQLHSPQLLTARQGLSNVPAYIQNMAPIPALDTFVTRRPDQSWASRRDNYQRLAEELEGANECLRKEMARTTIAEAEEEYITYSGLLAQINEVLQRKKRERTL